MNPSEPSLKSPKKMRIDMLLVARGLSLDLKQARVFILAGKVYVGTERVKQASEIVSKDAEVLVKMPAHPYVSRGGVKLATALDYFHLDVRGAICLDVGISTGGFTDCLLQRGAKQVLGVDVSYGQTDWSIRTDERVVLYEKTNIKKLPPNFFNTKIDWVVMDVSFTDLVSVVRSLVGCLSGSWNFIGLIKPQFEIASALVPIGGVVVDPDMHKQSIERVKDGLQLLGLQVMGVIPSSLKGQDGNQEFLIYARMLVESKEV